MITKDKEYTTRDGKEVRIYATDGVGPYSVHGAIKIGENWTTQTWTKSGSIHKFGSNHLDLIEKPKEYTVKVELVIKEITFKEGDGL